MNEANFEKNEYAEIAAELKKMRDADQVMRMRAAEKGGLIQDEEDNKLDEKHTARMKEIVEQIGWPSRSKVGKEGAQHAWLLVQHADHDPEFQARCLAMMRELPKGDVKPWQIAYLEDRIRVNARQPQLYGTQFYEDPEKGFGPRPIEDEEHLEERRKEMGLESFEEYRRELLEKYSEWEKKKQNKTETP